MRRVMLVPCLLALLLLCGSAVAATVKGTAQRNVLTGTPASDDLAGMGGDDRIQGLGGDDFVDGGDGVDALYGDGACTAAGADPVDCQRTGAGADTVLGGAG